MRKAALLATALAFVGAETAAAAPAPLASAGKAVISSSTDDLTLVRAKKKRAKKAAAATTPADAPAGSRATAPAVSNPTVTPSGQNPAVDQGMRARTGTR